MTVKPHLRGAKGAGWRVSVQQQTTRETETEKFITHRYGRKYTECLKETHGKSRENEDREKMTGLRHMP